MYISRKFLQFLSLFSRTFFVCFGDLLRSLYLHFKHLKLTVYFFIWDITKIWRDGYVDTYHFYDGIIIHFCLISCGIVIRSRLRGRVIRVLEPNYLFKYRDTRISNLKINYISFHTPSLYIFKIPNLIAILID